MSDADLLFAVKVAARRGFSEVKFLLQRMRKPEDPVWVAMGDSLISHSLLDLVAGRCQVSAKHLGVSGSPVSLNSTFAMCAESRVRQIPNEFDVLTIMGGTNDWRGNIPIGEVDDVDTGTFLGGYNRLLRLVESRNPRARILLMTPTYARAPEFAGQSEKAGERNKLGLTIEDYVDAVRELASHRRLEILDLYDLSGFKDSADMYFDDDDRIHFNGLAVNVLAELISGRLRTVVHGTIVPRAPASLVSHQ